MRQRIILTLVLAAFTAVSAIAQKSMLVAYDGGYFVKDGKKWCEYRPTDRAGKWAEYKQYKESEEFFYLKNKKCRVAVPKITKDKIFIKRKKKKEWEVVYTPLNIYTLCPEGGAPFYCYSSSKSEGHGYFVRDNNKWREYRPLMKRSRWAEFQQSSENSKYFIVESKHNTVYIPKSKEYNFIIKKKDNSSWQGGYTTRAIYDRSAAYQYNFYYQESLTANRKNDFKSTGKNARVSFDNNCNILIAVDGKFYHLTYTTIELADIDGKETILITIDKKNNVQLRSDGSCLINCKKIGKKRMLVGSKIENFNEVSNYLTAGTFKL